MHMPLFKREWTWDDLQELPDDGNRYEVIDGELFVTPSPAWRHQRAVRELFGLLHTYLTRYPKGEVLFAPADVMFSQRNAVQPDVFVVPFADGRLAEKFSDVGRLLLAAEILSPSSARADRVKKRTLYRERNVPEYWIVDLDALTFERSTPDDARPEILVDEVIWQPVGAAAPLVIDVQKYFSAVLGG